MRRRRSWSRCGELALASAAGLGLGCNAIMGYEPGTLDTMCCAAPTPVDWEGPAVLYSGPEPPPACTGLWEAGPMGGLAIEAPVTPCACGCGAATATCRALISFWSDGSCVGDAAAHSTTGDCTPVDVATPAAVECQLATTGAACSVREESTPEPAGFSVLAQLCLSLEPARCGDGLCDGQVPPGYGTRKCVYRAGEHSCPAGTYSDELTLFRAIDDQRACDCRCDASALACGGEGRVYEEDDCTGPSQSGPFGDCESLSLSAVESITVAAEVTGVCTPESFEVSGAVDGASLVTVCCEPGS